jgi:cyclopropane-fatty-acyl-phospholipid synthase
MEVMDLGCGWGSFTLWAAARMPRARFTAVSHAPAQRRFIEEAARARGLSNVRALTAVMNDFAADRRFDRIVSVEMFEHMHNAPRLMDRLADALRPGGRLFVHVFCHRELAYAFETEGATNWLGRHFFTGGIMPSATLLPRLQQRLRPLGQWAMSGEHYRRTANAWLRRLDARRARIRPILREVYGPEEGARWLHRWRVFFMAVAELFGHRGGREWGVAHHLLG